MILAGMGICVGPSVAEDQWPPAPPIEARAAAVDAVPLPLSISAGLPTDGEWHCRFRYRPQTAAQTVALVGSFNGWDRHANPMRGPNADGEWVGEVDLATGVYEYKFLVNGKQWSDDPANIDRIPDGFGKHNSRVRLGRLARMKSSPAKQGDGEIDVIGLTHRPHLPLYIQPLGAGQVSARYRTLAHDVERVWLAIKGGGMLEMARASEGPLFTYWEARAGVPAREKSRSPNVRSIQYTFVLEDGATRVGDPHTYRYSFTSSGIFETPQWARHAVWYQIMLDRFRNGDAGNDPDPVRPWTSEWFTPSPWEQQGGQTFYDNFVFDRFYGGDIDGLAEMLPYLKELGVNTLYLNPVFESPSYHKYDIGNFVHIDDSFGTRGDYDSVAPSEDLRDPSTWQWTETDRHFVEFLKHAHQAGFRVVLDGVFNHVGLTHPAFVDVQQNGRKSPYADWFEVTSWEPFTYKGWADFAHMPVFKKDRQGFAGNEVEQHIFAITRRWMDPNGDGDPSDGIDGWRLDVPNDIPLHFWAQWRQLVKQINPEALITGEIWHRADQWLDGAHFDAVMNYEFAKAVTSWIFDRQHKIGARELAARLAELRLAYPAAATYALQNLVSSHDTDRLASMAQNPDRAYDRQNRVQDDNPEYDNSKPSADAYARARLVALLQMTYVGAPMIYYGDEVGMWGADDPTNRKPMLWQDLEPYEQPEENAVMSDHLAFYKQVIALRNSHAALRSGSFRSLLADDEADVWAFLRSDEHESLIVVLNPSTAQREVAVPLPTDAPSSWDTVFGSAGQLQAENGKLTISVPPVGGVVIHANSGEATASAPK